MQGVASKGGRFLEAPVSGSKKPAEDGQLIILAAGEKVIDEFFVIYLPCYHHIHLIDSHSQFDWALRALPFNDP